MPPDGTFGTVWTRHSGHEGSVTVPHGSPRGRWKRDYGEEWAESAVLEEIANLGRNVFKHDGERLPEITSSSEFFPVDLNFEAISGFSDVLDLVHSVSDAIGELRDFLHLRLGSNRSVGVRLDAGRRE